MKSELKELAQLIRDIRRDAKTVEGMSRHAKHLQANTYGAQFRTLHTIYCLLRGRTMEQIEPNYPSHAGTYDTKWRMTQIHQRVALKQGECNSWRASLEAATNE